MYNILYRWGRYGLEHGMMVLCAVCLALAFVLFLKEKRRIHKERLLMTKLRGGNFYASIYEMVRYARKHDLDQVRIERNRIVFSAVCPPGKLCEYSLSGSGVRVLSDCRARVLAEVLGEDIPKLKTSMYSLRRYRVMRPNGKIDFGYVYTIRPLYKARLVYAKRFAPIR